MKKTLLYRLMFVALLSIFLTQPSLANGDEIMSKLAIGLTKDAVIAIMQSEPDEQGCKSYLGVSACKLIWSKGLISKSRYEVEFVAGRLVTAQHTKLRGLL